MSEQQVAGFNLLNRLNLCGPLVRKWSTHCESISTDKPPKRPDPAIYSQLQRLSQGTTASWNSPDIQANQWDEWRFMDSIEVKVRNKSNESSAVNTVVEVKWAPFGIGTTFSSLGAQVINLGIAPDEKIMRFPINDDVRALGDDVSIQVNISHPHDMDAGNNTGFHAIHGVLTSKEGRSPILNFPVVNNSAATETITLIQLGINDIGSALTPYTRVYAPNEQITATLAIQPIPASITPPVGGYILKETTVVGYDSSGKLLGGVTLVIRVDS